MSWGRYDEVLVEVFRPDGSLRYLLRQRNLQTGDPHNLVIEVVDNRSKEEARQDSSMMQAEKAPKRATLGHSFLNGVPRGWMGVLILLTPGIQRQSASLAGMEPVPLSTKGPIVGLGTDNGSRAPLSIGNTGLGTPGPISACSTAIITRHTPGDTVMQTAEFSKSQIAWFFEAIYWLNGDPICRHILSRPVVNAHKTRVTFFLVSA